MYKYFVATFVLVAYSFFYTQNVKEPLQKLEQEIQQFKEENLFCFI